MRGDLIYWVREGKGRLKSVKLTVCNEKDSDVLNEQGVVELRRQRVQRLLDQARNQGAKLSYRDLSLILLTSKATLKRDIKVGKK